MILLSGFDGKRGNIKQIINIFDARFSIFTEEFILVGRARACARAEGLRIKEIREPIVRSRLFPYFPLLNSNRSGWHKFPPLKTTFYAYTTGSYCTNTYLLTFYIFVHLDTLADELIIMCTALEFGVIQLLKAFLLYGM